MSAAVDGGSKVGEAFAKLTFPADSTLAKAELRAQGYVERIAASLNDTVGDTNLRFLGEASSPSHGRKVRGKVRDIYDTGSAICLVATDRLSAFDRNLAEIPFKGAVLNQISRWWFKQTSHIVPNHLLPTEIHPNVTMGRKCEVFPIEFVVRGYITGSTGTSMWTHYDKGERQYCGHRLPEGLVKHQRLEKNILTPTTKSDEHDELISAERIVAEGHMSKDDWDYCASKALQLFEYGQKVALQHGMILVDTKYEFGRDCESGKILLVDEIHTPDSSRYWIADTYDACMKEGCSPANVDKEFVRLWFRKRCDPYVDEQLPDAPPQLRTELSRRYILLYEVITGEKFSFPTYSGDVNKDIIDRLAQVGMEKLS